MRKQFKRETFAATPRADSRPGDEQEELALLAEFTRHDSVAGLASAIAARLGGDARTLDLIARADLLPGRRRGWRRAQSRGN